MLQRPKANKYLASRRSSSGVESVASPVTIPAPSPDPAPAVIVQLEREPSARVVTPAPLPQRSPSPPPPPEQLEQQTAPSPPPADTCGPGPGAVLAGPPGPGMEPFFLTTDTVKAEDLPKLHHAELCSVRRETASVSSDCSVTSSSSDEEAGDSGRSVLMVNINPVTAAPADQQLQASLSQVKIEAPPQRQNVWGPSPRHSQQHDAVDMVGLQIHQQQQQQQWGDGPVSEVGEPIFSHSASTFYPKATTNYMEEQHVEPLRPSTELNISRVSSFKANRSVSFENALDTETESDVPTTTPVPRESEDDPILPERSFQDPAFTNYVDSQKDKSAGKPKKKGFLSSLFKKSGKRQQQPYGDDYIHIERRVDKGDTSESEADAKIHDLMDQSPRFHILSKDDGSPGSASSPPPQMPTVPMPGSPAARQLFPQEPDQRHEAPLDHQGVAIQEVTKTPQNIYGEIADVTLPESVLNNFSDIQNLPQDKQTDLIDKTETEQQEANQSSVEYSLPQQKPTSLDDLLDDTNPPPAEISPPASIDPPQQRFIPEHERTQEIDIDALLNLSSTPEETEEDLEAEESGQFSFTSSTQQTIFHRDTETEAEKQSILTPQHQLDNVVSDEQTYLSEQLRLEEEQQHLVNQNKALEQQLVDKENERLKVMDIDVAPPVSNGDVVGNLDVEISNEEVSNTSFRERRKPKSMFNFDSFRKPKHKTQQKPNSVNTHTPSKENNKVLNSNYTQESLPTPALSPDIEEDLATKIVREIQKSTTELNVKQKTEAKPSFFNPGSLRKSVRGRNNKRGDMKGGLDMPEPNDEVDKEEEEIVNEQESIVVTSVKEEDVPSAKKKEKEKKPSMFSLRSSSKDRKNQRRPISMENTVQKESETIVEERKSQNGFGSMFGSNKQRSRSNEKPKNPESHQAFPSEEIQSKEHVINTSSPHENTSHIRGNQEHIEDSSHLNQSKVDSDKKEKKGFSSLFGSSKQKQRSKSQERQPRQAVKVPSPGDKTTSVARQSRPTERPPPPPAKSKSGLSDFFAASNTSGSSPAPPVVEVAQKPEPEPRKTDLHQTHLPSPDPPHNMQTPSRNQEEVADARRVSESLNNRKSAFLQSTLQNDAQPEVSPNQPPQQLSPQQDTRPPSRQNPGPSLNSSFSEEQAKLRQTGRQSGRFRKSASAAPLVPGPGQHRLSVPGRPPSSTPPAPAPATSMMDTLIIDSLARPTTPHQDPRPPKKTSSVSRTESYRRARGAEADPEQRQPRVVRRNETYNSLPRQNSGRLQRRNSEDSLRNAMNSDQTPVSSMPRSKSRQEKKGECNVM